MPQFEKEINSINKKIVSLERNLEAVGRIDARIKVIEAVNSKLIASNKEFEKVSEKISNIEKKIESSIELGNRISIIERELKEKRVEPKREFEKLINENIELKIRLDKEVEILQSIKKDYVKLQEVNKELQDHFEYLTKSLSSISFDDLTYQFKNAVESINDRMNTETNQSYFIDNLDIELKTGLEYGEELRLVQALSKKDRTENLSTIKFSLKPKTNIKITD